MNNRIINLTVRKLRPAFAAAALVGLMALSVSAADQKAALDPRADELLKRMGDYLGHAEFFSVSAEVWQDIQLSFTTKLPDFVFQFEPPAGASKIQVKEMKTENQSHKKEEK